MEDIQQGTVSNKALGGGGGGGGGCYSIRLPAVEKVVEDNKERIVKQQQDMNKALLFAILSLLQSVSSFFSSHQILPQVSLRLEMSNLERGLYLERLVAKKKVEVENLLRRHQAADDPLVLRLNYAASECKMNLSRALRLDGYGEEKLHTMSITVDMKRRSPTLPDARSVVEFEDAGHFGQLLTQVELPPTPPLPQVEADYPYGTGGSGRFVSQYRRDGIRRQGGGSEDCQQGSAIRQTWEPSGMHLQGHHPPPYPSEVFAALSRCLRLTGSACVRIDRTGSGEWSLGGLAHDWRGGW
eukprot:scaffold988_cov165-Ochromonas_danica.AAC.23